MKIPKEEDKLHPENWHDARVKEILDAQEGQFGEYLPIIFQTQHGEVRGTARTKVKPTTKLTEWSCAILNCSFDQLADPFDPMVLKGYPCRIFVEHKENNGRTYGNVKTVITFEENGEKQPQPPLTDDYQAEADIPF